MLARLDAYAYEMAPAKYLEELVATSRDRRRSSGGSTLVRR